MTRPNMHFDNMHFDRTAAETKIAAALKPALRVVATQQPRDPVHALATLLVNHSAAANSVDHDATTLNSVGHAAIKAPPPFGSSTDRAASRHTAATSSDAAAPQRQTIKQLRARPGSANPDVASRSSARKGGKSEGGKSAPSKQHPRWSVSNASSTATLISRTPSSAPPTAAARPARSPTSGRRARGQARSEEGLTDEKLMEQVLRIEAEAKEKVAAMEWEAKAQDAMAKAQEAKAQARDAETAQAVTALATDCARRSIDRVLHTVAQRNFEASVGGITPLKHSYEIGRRFDLGCSYAL